MNAFRKKTGNEHGSALLFVIFILAVVTILGISITNIANKELSVSTTDKSYKIAFYHAEGGVYTIAKWISYVVDEYELPEQGNMVYQSDVALLLREAMGYVFDEDDDIGIGIQTPSGIDSTVNVNFTRSRTQVIAGGGAASLGEGTSGVGTGPTLGLPYWVISTATTPTNTTTTIVGKYLKVDGITGGLD